MYSESIEEYRYVESLKREKRAFEDLLAKKSNLVISFEDFTVDLSTNNVNNNEDTTSSSITSFLPTKETKLSTKIIVDMREFGSSLPSLLHRSGMQIDPVTLQVMQCVWNYIHVYYNSLKWHRSVITSSLRRYVSRENPYLIYFSLLTLVDCTLNLRP
jgi:hypothetical protein